MSYFTDKELFFLVPLDGSDEELQKLDEYLSVLEESGVGEIIEEATARTYPAGRAGYDPCSLFATVAYCFAMGRGSLREIEEMCRYDMRSMYLMGQKRPSYKTISEFISKVVVPRAYEIFVAVTSCMVRRYSLDVSDQYIDGTKIEANANRYKFVWKPRKHRENLECRIGAQLKAMGAPPDSQGSVDAGRLLSFMREYAEKNGVSEAAAISPGKGHRISEEARKYRELYRMLSKLAEYDEIDEICGQGRNSYYKTDHDATAMCMKDDYYSGRGSSMHAAYNVQFIVSSGIITYFGVFQDRNDYYTLIPMLSGYRRHYGRHPENICADSGYGILANYRYIDENGIGNYVKFQSWNGESSGKRPQLFFPEGETFRCLNGKLGICLGTPAHGHVRGSQVFEFRGCLGCRYAWKCRERLACKDSDSRQAELSIEYERYKQKARDNLLTIRGLEMRINRTIQAEGNFGQVKQNMHYVRFRRRSMPKVRAEIMLVCLGRNIRKIFALHGKTYASSKFWTAPPSQTQEVFPPVKQR